MRRSSSRTSLCATAAAAMPLPTTPRTKAACAEDPGPLRFAKDKEATFTLFLALEACLTVAATNAPKSVDERVVQIFPHSDQILRAAISVLANYGAPKFDCGV